MPIDMWIDTDRSSQCVGCRCVLCTWGAVPVSLTEIRGNPFNYPPEPGPAFLSPLCLCYHTYLTLSFCCLHILPYFFPPLHSFAPLCHSTGPPSPKISQLLFSPFDFMSHCSTPPQLSRVFTHPCFKIGWQQIQKSFCLKCHKVIQK